MRLGQGLRPAHFHRQWRVDRLKKLPQLTILDLLRDPQQIPSRSTTKEKKKKKKNRDKREHSSFEVQQARQSAVPGVRTTTLGALSMRNRQMTTTAPVNKRKREIIHIGSSDDDELAPTSPVMPLPLPHQPTITALLEFCSDSRTEDELVRSSDSEVNSMMSSRNGIVYDVDDERWVQESEVRAGKQARVKVDDEVNIKEVDL
jgi:hypothetical protein